MCVFNVSVINTIYFYFIPLQGAMGISFKGPSGDKGDKGVPGEKGQPASIAEIGKLNDSTIIKVRVNNYGWVRASRVSQFASSMTP